MYRICNHARPSATPAKALAEIERAIEAWLAVAREDGLPIPESAARRRPGSGPCEL
jgi:predicted RNase H-like HicB family nuclease